MEYMGMQWAEKALGKALLNKDCHITLEHAVVFHRYGADLLAPGRFRARFIMSTRQFTKSSTIS